MRSLSLPLVGLLLTLFSALGRLGCLAQGQQPSALERRQMRSLSMQRRYYIQGRVLDANTAEPIHQARVSLTTVGGGIPIGETITDAEGSFFFPNLGPATYELWVTCQEYQDGRESVELSIGPNAGVSVFLAPKLIRRGPAWVEPLSAEEQQAPKEARHAYEKGVDELRQHHWQESRTQFEKAVELYPRYASAQAGLGKVLLQQGELEAAQRAFEAATEINPNYAFPRIYLGGIYNAQGQFPGAVEQLQKAVALQPNSWLGHFELSRAYWGLHDVAHAEEHITRAHELETRVPQVHLMRANIFGVRQDYAGAVKEMDEFLALVPAGPLAEQVRERRAEVQGKLTPPEKPVARDSR